MADKDLSFNIVALDKASSTFVRMAEQVERLTRKLDDLDGKSVSIGTEEAARKLEELRAEMDSLSDVHVGVDIDEEQARARIARIRAQLDELSGRDVAASVRVEAAAAKADLDEVERKLARVDGRDARASVHVDADSSSLDQYTGRLGALAAALLALGGPIGGAIAGLAALGAGGVVGAAGLGSVLLGLGGVAKALKAQEAQENETGKSAQQSAAAQLAATDSVLGAQDRLRDAKRSVADAERRSADEVRSALGAQARAEEGLQRAQESAVRAQRNLNDARRQAARDLEDLSNRTKDDALAQREAVLRVQEAQDNLTKVQNDPSATARQREEAQLQYEEAQQHLDEISLSYQRDQADAADAAKAGVEGSRQVVAAQDQVLASQRAVHDAQVAVGDAARRVDEARISGAEAVTRAQEQVLAAQRALTLAQAQATAATSAQSAATQKLNKALEDLSPAGRRFYDFAVGLKPKLLELQQVSQEGFLPGFQAGAEALLPLFPQISSNVGTLSHSMGQFFATLGQGMASPFWQDFFARIANASTTLFPAFAQSMLTAGHAAAVFTEDMLPLAPKALEAADAGSHLLESWAPFFAQAGGPWLASLKTFIGDLTPLGPVIADLGPILADISNAAGHVLRGALEALHPILTGLTPIIHGFSAVLQMIPAPLEGVIVDLRLLSLAAKPVQALFGAAAFAVQSFGLRAAETAEKGGVLSGAATGVAGAGERLSGVLTKVGSALPIVGAVVIGLGAAYDEVKNKSDDLATSILNGSTTIEESRKKIAAHNDTVNQWAADLPFLQESMDEVNASIQDQISKMPPLQAAQARVTLAQAQYNDAVKQFGLDSPQAADAQVKLAEATNRYKDAQHDAEQATKSLTQRIVEQTNIAAGAANADIAYQQALLGIKDAQERASEAARQYGEGSRQAQEAVLGLEQQVLAAADAARRKAEADAAALSDSDRAKAGADAYADTLRTLAGQISGPAHEALLRYAADVDRGRSAAAAATDSAHVLSTAIGDIPLSKNVEIISNAPEISADVRALHHELDLLPREKIIRIGVHDTSNISAGAQPYAAGGIAAPMARGGVLPMAAGGPLRFISGAAATVVPPNTPRLIGDNTQVPELFAPLDGSARSLSYIAYGARAFGYDLVAGATSSPAGSSAPSAVNIRPGAAAGDAAALAAALAAAVGEVVDRVGDAVYGALHQARLQIDGSGVARLVNQANALAAAR